MKKEYVLILIITLITILGIINLEWADNLHFFSTIIITPLFIFVGSTAQKTMKAKTAKRPQNGIELNVVTSLLFGANLMISVMFGHWFRVICWSLLTIIWISTAVQKYEYIKYFKKKEMEEPCELKPTS